jgi:hypothetical protein
MQDTGIRSGLMSCSKEHFHYRCVKSILRLTQFDLTEGDNPNAIYKLKLVKKKALTLTKLFLNISILFWTTGVLALKSL